MKIGAHLSTSGGLIKALDNAEAIGANALQIFSSAPLQWKASQHSSEEKALFKKEALKRDIQPVFIHGTYLVNLATDDNELQQKSVQSLIHDLTFASNIGAQGVIFHFGSHPTGWEGKKDTLTPLIHHVLKHTPGSTEFIIENAAGSGAKIGASLEELATMIKDINHPRVRICVDTAHAFASGYDLRTKQAVNTFVSAVQNSFGWEVVSAIHLNDSKVDFAKKADRHENIGKGYIGNVGLQAFVTHPKITDIPFILEVPGFHKNGPDKENIDRVKRYSS